MAEKENSFVSHSTFAPPFEMKGLRQWLNIQHTGKPNVPLKAKVSDELKVAHHRVGGHRSVAVQFVIDEQGEWDIEELGFNGKKYKLVEVS